MYVSRTDLHIGQPIWNLIPEEMDTSSLSIHRQAVALPLGVQPCEIDPIHIVTLTDVLIIQVLFRSAESSWVQFTCQKAMSLSLALAGQDNQCVRQDLPTGERLV